LYHSVGRLGVHDIEHAMDDLVTFESQEGGLSSEPKCNTLIIGTVDQDLRECCHAMLFAFVG